jgi:hypothetical protein
MKHLEEFVKIHRTEIDTHEPDGGNWIAIEKKLPKQIMLPVFYWKIAAVVFFMSSAFLGVSEFKRSSSVTQGSGDFKSTEAFYLSEIQLRADWIKASDQEMDFTHYRELVELEAMYEVLHNKWQEQPESFLEEAMKLNLIVRLDLLNRNLQPITTSPHDFEIQNERFLQ